MERATAPAPPSQDRLDSWKEIAAYLNRGVRTVQRWELLKGLPVRRLPGGDQARVYALKSELDQWWNGRDTETADPQSDARSANLYARGLRRGIALWIAVPVLVLVVLALLMSSPHTGLPTNATPVPLVSMGGLASRPSVAPDGSRVAFQWSAPVEFSHQGTEDRCGIYVKQIGERPPARLTNHEMDRDPSWSPDGRFIAYVRGYGMQAEIRLSLSGGGSDSKIVTLNSGRYGHLSWTPDGRFLVLSSRTSLNEPYSLWALSVRSGERWPILPPPPVVIHDGDDTQGDLIQALSPDGTVAVFARAVATGVYRLFAVRLTPDLHAAGAPWRVVDRTHAFILGAAWMGDREIVYAASDGVSRLWRVQMSGQASPQLLTWASPMPQWPTVAGSQRRLVYAASTFITDLWRRDMRTGESRLWISSGFRQWAPSYSPDGRKVAFSSNRSGDVEVWTCDADGQNCRQLTFLHEPCCAVPRWSPDGRLLAFESRVNGKPQVYVVPAEGGEPRSVTPGDWQNQFANWSRDGQWIYFESDRSGQWRIWKIPAVGGDAIQMTQRTSGAAFESADGQWLFYASLGFDGGVIRNGALYRVPVAGGEEAQVAAKISNFLSVSVTGRGVYFMEDPRTLKLLDPATAVPNTAARFERESVSQGITVSPDDAFMIFNKVGRSSVDIMMVDLTQSIPPPFY